MPLNIRIFKTNQPKQQFVPLSLRYYFLLAPVRYFSSLSIVFQRAPLSLSKNRYCDVVYYSSFTFQKTRGSSFLNDEFTINRYVPISLSRTGDADFWGKQTIFQYFHRTVSLSARVLKLPWRKERRTVSFYPSGPLTYIFPQPLPSFYYVSCG